MGDGFISSLSGAVEKQELHRRALDDVLIIICIAYSIWAGKLTNAGGRGEVYYCICLLCSSDFVHNHCWNTVATLSEMIGNDRSGLL